VSEEVRDPSMLSVGNNHLMKVQWRENYSQSRDGTSWVEVRDLAQQGEDFSKYLPFLRHSLEELLHDIHISAVTLYPRGGMLSFFIKAETFDVEQGQSGQPEAAIFDLHQILSAHS
jgi:hypothetical protein